MRFTRPVRDRSPSRRARLSFERLEDRTVPSTFSWRVDADGNWSNPNNWTLLAGPVGSGFPNAVGDAVLLVNTISANRTITIPNGVTITIGSLQINDSHNFTIAAAGTGKLIIDNTGSGNATVLVANSLGNGTPTISAPITLADTLQVTNQSTGTLTITGAIGESAPGQGLIADGTGTVRLTGIDVNNSFTGDTVVQNGTLELGKTRQSPSAIPAATPGNLTITGGTVRELASNQIADAAAVTLSAGSTFDLNGQTDGIAALTVSGSRVTVGTGAVSFSALTMTGGSITATGTGEVQVRGNATINASAGGSTITGGRVQLGGATRTFTVADGAAAIDLDINSEIRQDTSATAGLTKAGAGTLRLEGPTSNAYTGPTTVSAGTLELDKIGVTGVAVAVAGDLVINGATVREVVNNQLGDLSAVAINAGSVFDLNGQSDTVGAVTVVGGTLSTNGGRLSAGNTTFNGTATLAMKLNGSSGPDRIATTGTVAVGGILQLSLTAPVPPGTAITLIDNDGADAVTGTFAGLAPGTTVNVGGQLFVISYAAGTGNDVVLTRLVLPPRVDDVQINGGVAQRSMVTSVTVTFNAVVTFAGTASQAFSLTRQGDPVAVGLSATASNATGVTVVTLSGFTGASASNGSLADGTYSLRALSGQITASGAFLDGNGDGAGTGTPADDFVFADSGTTRGNQFYRLFGDATGDRMVNQADLSLFTAAFGTATTDITFDFDRNGVINVADLNAFRANFGAAV
jgi:autotransporter-associated beta strand protein